MSQADSEETWQTKWRTTTLAKMEMCEYENQTLEAFAAASRLYAKFDCPVARQDCSLLATAHDCETGLLPTCHIRKHSAYL